jgi:4-diphosphocytidyl-2-C-methyl-D-erythritol kinase
VQIRQSATGVEILAPAKINLFFEVLNRRDDGFHEIETLMVPIAIFDTLSFEDNDSGQVTISVRSAQSVTQTPELIPKGEDNLAVRAVRRLAEHANIAGGARLRLIKRIPMAAGLGGGSSDAAAALVAANLVWNLNFTLSQLSAVAATLGSDIPFFLTSRPAICAGRGERIQQLNGLGGLHLVILKPPEGLSTAAVYKACRPAASPRTLDPMIKALRNINLAVLGHLVHNRLLEPAQTMSPWINKSLSRLRAQHCPAIGMSGSGTSCFALCRSARHARSVAARLRATLTDGSAVWATRSI